LELPFKSQADLLAFFFRGVSHSGFAIIAGCGFATKFSAVPSETQAASCCGVPQDIPSFKADSNCYLSCRRLFKHISPPLEVRRVFEGLEILPTLFWTWFSIFLGADPLPPRRPNLFVLYQRCPMLFFSPPKSFLPFPPE